MQYGSMSAGCTVWECAGVGSEDRQKTGRQMIREECAYEQAAPGFKAWQCCLEAQLKHARRQAVCPSGRQGTWYLSSWRQ